MSEFADVAARRTREIMEQETSIRPRPPHGIFCFNGDAYQAQDVLAIERFHEANAKTWSIYVRLRGIQESSIHKFESAKLRDEAWAKAVAEWCAATLAAKWIP